STFPPPPPAEGSAPSGVGAHPGMEAFAPSSSFGSAPHGAPPLLAPLPLPALVEPPRKGRSGLVAFVLLFGVLAMAAIGLYVLKHRRPLVAGPSGVTGVE